MPCLDRMSATGLPAGLRWAHDSWEAKRDVKGWLSKQLPHRRSYKPTVDQLPMTRLIDLDVVRGAKVPSFGSLERALEFLVAGLDSQGRVYPPRAASESGE